MQGKARQGISAKGWAGRSPVVAQLVKDLVLSQLWLGVLQVRPLASELLCYRQSQKTKKLKKGQAVPSLQAPLQGWMTTDGRVGMQNQLPLQIAYCMC